MPIADDFFPASPRVIYRKSPLTQVICQLRYPSVLKIEANAPAEFQDRIRRAFPYFERANVANIGAGQQLPAELVQIFAQQFTANYVFRSEDKTAEIHLSPDALSLTSRSYSRWEEFKKLFVLSLKALVDVYDPSFFSRIGLRYVNSINRETIGLGDRNWSGLLIPELLGELSISKFEVNVEEARRLLRVRSKEPNGSFLLQHGLNKLPDSQHSLYVIDFDFYNDGKTECHNAESTLDSLNSRAGRAFRWCITDELHNALGPEGLDSNGN
jgi:uncharacterized protein (TIGR04255 family)